VERVERVDEGTQRHKARARLLDTTRRLLRVRLARFGFGILLLVMVCVAFAEWIAPHDPLEQNLRISLQPPSRMHLLGTDKLGRDALSRLIYGSRVAMAVSAGAISFSICVGGVVGLVSAYFRGWLDAVLMRVMDALISFPSLILALVLVYFLGDTLINVIIALGIANTPWMARIVRSQALSVREQTYVTAARSIGGSDWRIIMTHIFPNSLAPLLVQGTISMAYAILTEAAMGFLGASVQPPTPTWGNMLRFSYGYIDVAPWLSIAPGVAIFVTVLAVNFAGDALRDTLDPRLRGLIH